MFTTYTQRGGSMSAPLETAEDRRLQTEIVEMLAGWLGVDAYHTDRFYDVDAFLRRRDGGPWLAAVEVKCRRVPIATYPTWYVDLKKWEACLRVGRSFFGARARGVVRLNSHDSDAPGP
jgi:hypothetical protein